MSLCLIASAQSASADTFQVNAGRFPSATIDGQIYSWGHIFYSDANLPGGIDLQGTGVNLSDLSYALSPQTEWGWDGAEDYTEANQPNRDWEANLAGGTVTLDGRRDDGQPVRGTLSADDGTDIKAVSKANSHLLALDKQGKVWEWWVTSNTTQFTSINISDRITKVMTVGFTDVNGAIKYFNMALAENGTIWTWGDDNSSGQLGDGTTKAHSSPQKIKMPDNATFVDFDATAQSDARPNERNNGISTVSGPAVIAVDTKGNVWLWGSTVAGNGSYAPFLSNEGTIKATAGYVEPTKALLPSVESTTDDSCVYQTPQSGDPAAGVRQVLMVLMGGVAIAMGVAVLKRNGRLVRRI